MAMTGYDYNYDFQVREVGPEVVVTNNLGRTALHKEIVYLGGVLGVVEEFGGIANGATGRITPLSADMEITTAQVDATDTFTAGNDIYFLSGGSGAAGTLVDTPTTATVPAGKVTAEFGNGGAQTAVVFRPFNQGGEAAPGRYAKVVETAITADATAGVVVPLPLGAKIIDMWAIATATSGSGSVTLKTGAGSPATIATAIALATDQAVSRLAAGVDDTKLIVGADGIKLFTAGATDRGLVYIQYI